MKSEQELLGARRLRELLRRHDVRPRHQLGQNFVVDPNTIRKMIGLAAVGEEDVVAEVGAGAGSLTIGLAGTARRVIAIEVDRRLVPVLSESLSGIANVDVVHADVLRLDLSSTGANKLVGNLPYNIAATVVLKTLEQSPGIGDLTVMTQSEVGARLAARPGSKVYGLTSVLVAYFAKARVVSRVSRRAFYPIPRVDSVIVKIERTPSLPDVPGDRFFDLVRTAFSQRRKTLRNALADTAGSPAAAEQLLRRAGVDPAARAEEIDFEGFAALTKALS